MGYWLDKYAKDFIEEFNSHTGFSVESEADLWQYGWDEPVQLSSGKWIFSVGFGNDYYIADTESEALDVLGDICFCTGVDIDGFEIHFDENDEYIVDEEGNIICENNWEAYRKYCETRPK